ncbi:MAG: tRNA (N(6)-L-threonylcarbamoyladenosine(37)-C(2))-methylthiotransferase MtaB [Magnetococcales bacterium]|nr:tRNA (N(6)-L-threonylcarbamoyladenosine(37)-C(2))-methylthiotransferase MtaB [Magnetococcales bacterium]
MIEKKKYGLAVVDMGCRVNQVEGEKLRLQGREQGWRLVSTPGEADVVVVNTCAVTAESERQARQAIRRLIREHPEVRVVVTGCYAQRDAAALEAMPGVAAVVPMAGKDRLLEDLAGAKPDPLPDGLPAPPVSTRTRHFLKVQDGCDHRCTYCVIPALRGAARSVSPEEVVAMAREARAQGNRELVLTGIDLGSYGRDIGTGLAFLVSELLRSSPELERLRLSSIDPLDIDAELAALLAGEERLMPHLHLSIQSGSDRVRKRMARRGGGREVIEKLRELTERRPDLVLGGDFIVGFPTESEADFDATLELVRESGLCLLHVFRYSPRPGTPAARIPPRFQVSGDIQVERSARLRAVGRAALLQRLRQRLGSTDTLLVEERIQGRLLGKTPGFLPVSVADPDLRDRRGQIVGVRLSSVDSAEEGWLGEVTELSTELSTACG